MQFNRFAACLLVATVVAGCSAKPDAPGDAGTKPSDKAVVSSVKPTGKVITIEMYSDAQGNYFKPAKLEAHQGDMLRFVLKMGVHNVHFLPDSNPGKSGLPPASDLLQLPDQTWEYVVSLAPGHYYFQCDPHALLGMNGRLDVEGEK